MGRLRCHEQMFDHGTMVAIARAPLDAALAERVRPVTLARDRHVPVRPALERLLPNGLQQGIAVSVTAGAGGGATTLALALAAGISEAGGWIAAIRLPNLGLVASAQLGVALERLALVNCPPAQTSQIVAALVDGFPMVLVGPSMLGARDGRRLAVRLRERGTVLVIVDGDLADGATTRAGVPTGSSAAMNCCLKARSSVVKVCASSRSERSVSTREAPGGPDAHDLVSAERSVGMASREARPRTFDAQVLVSATTRVRAES